GIRIALAVDFDVVVLRGALPSADAGMVAGLEKFPVQRIGREVLVALHHNAIVARGEHGAVPGRNRHIASLRDCMRRSPRITSMEGPILMIDHRTATFSSGDVEISYRLFGKPGDTPIVIVHGLSYFSYDWIPMAAVLAADRQVAAMD